MSPLIGAFYLKALDEALGSSGLHYVRYMDDIVVLAPSRWRLRHTIRSSFLEKWITVRAI